MHTTLRSCLMRARHDHTWIKPPRKRFKSFGVMCAGKLPRPVETSEGLYRFQVPVNDRGESLTVLSDPAHRYGYCIGNQLWSSAEELARYLSRFPDACFRGKRVLELGAGLGLPGQALLRRGSKVTFTDQSQMLALLKRNIEENFGKDILKDTDTGSPRAAVLPLQWGCDLASIPRLQTTTPFDFVIGSDICYDPDKFMELIQTIRALEGAMVIFTFPPRDETMDFLETCTDEGYGWRLLSVIDEAHLINPVHIIQLLPSSSSQKRQLILWDFDHSLIEENSDTWVIDKIGAQPIFERMRENNDWGWTRLMDQTFLHANTELGKSDNDIKEACRSVSLHEDLAEVIQFLGSQDSIDMVIVSDANTIFIDEILNFYGLKDCFQEIYTNPAQFVEGALRVNPYHSNSHSCKICPSNLCKGQVLEGLLFGNKYGSVTYVGDGGGDYCPCTKMGPMDTVLARASYSGSNRICPLLKALSSENFAVYRSRDIIHPKQDSDTSSDFRKVHQNEGYTSAPVVRWENSKDLASVLKALHLQNFE